MRDRLARAERNHTNLQTNSRDFKLDTQSEFKEVNSKLDDVMKGIASINVVIAKWLGGGIALMTALQFAADHFLK